MRVDAEGGVGEGGLLVVHHSSVGITCRCETYFILSSQTMKAIGTRPRLFSSLPFMPLSLTGLRFLGSPLLEFSRTLSIIICLPYSSLLISSSTYSLYTFDIHNYLVSREKKKTPSCMLFCIRHSLHIVTQDCFLHLTTWLL